MHASSSGRRSIMVRPVKLLFFAVLMLVGMALLLALAVIEQVQGNGSAGQLFWGLFGLCLFLLGGYFFVLLALVRRRLEPAQRSAPFIRGGILSTFAIMCPGLTFACQYLLALWLGNSWVPLVAGVFFGVSGGSLALASIKRFSGNQTR